MYQVDTRLFTSKLDPKVEFARYFKSSGADDALKKAMILLYRMPVKPDNLAEFFSEYFDNGAQRLMRISLLKAELCYKNDELENCNKQVKATEDRISELLNKLGISQEEFNQRFIPQQTKGNDRHSILEQYFKDIENGPETTPYVPGDDMSVAGDVDADAEAELVEPLTDLECKGEECLALARAPSEDTILKDVIRELDPWGIICRLPALQRTNEKAKEKLKIANDMNGNQVEANLFEEQKHVRSHTGHEPDDDDGATLADIFCQFAFDSNIDQDERTVRLHNQLLSVKKVDNSGVKLADFMGWSAAPSREDVPASRQGTSSPSEGDEGGSGDAASTFSKQKPSEREVDGPGESEFLPNNALDENFTDIDKLKRKPCQDKVLKMVTSEGLGKPKTPQEETDAFLFDDVDEDNLIENAYKMMEMEPGHQDFVFEFPEFSRVYKSVCSASEDNKTCSRPPTTGSISGQMNNWTRQFNEYVDAPSDGGEGFFEEGDAQMWMSRPPTNRTSGGDSISRASHPIERVDSSCHCILGSTYSASEMYDGDGESTGRKKRSTEEKRRSIGQEDEETTAEDAVLAHELDEVFKKNRRRSSSVKNGSKNKKEEVIDDEVEDNIQFVQSYVDGVADLAKDIRETFLGNSEVNVAPPPTQTGQGDVRASVPVLTKYVRKSTKN